MVADPGGECSRPRRECAVHGDTDLAGGPDRKRCERLRNHIRACIVEQEAAPSASGMARLQIRAAMPGARISWMVSPSRLRIRAVRKMARPGKVGSHQLVRRYCWPALTIAPHSGVPMAAPRPR